MTATTETAAAPATATVDGNPEQLAHIGCPLCLEERVLNGRSTYPDVQLCGYVWPENRLPRSTVNPPVCARCEAVSADDAAVVAAIRDGPCFRAGLHVPPPPFPQS